LKKVRTVILYITLLFFSFLMLRITIPYLSLNDNTAFLQIKQWVIHNQVWKFSFYTHVFTSIFLLLAGFTQFSDTFLKKKKDLHRKFGYAYVIILLGASAPAGFVMSLYANGGILSQIAFSMLSVLWFYFTLQAFLKAKKKDFIAHRNFMIRSYALTLSALTLRAWKLSIVLLFHPPPMDVYRIVAWLGWIPNLLLAEYIIRKRREGKNMCSRDVGQKVTIDL
jgi:uncharacterized membrane protein